MKKERKSEDILNFSPNKLQIRASETVSLAIPTDTIHSLERVAASRDMSMDALLKFYIGQCLRQDLDRLNRNLGGDPLDFDTAGNSPSLLNQR